MNRQEFIEKWAHLVPSDKKEEFKSDFLDMILGKSHINKKESLSTPYQAYNDDLAI